MEAESIYLYWNIANSGILTVLAVFTFWTNRQKAHQNDISGIQKEISQINVRLSTQEEAMRHVPDKQELATLHKRITEVSESQKVMQGEVVHIGKTLDLIHSYLMSNTGKPS